MTIRSRWLRLLSGLTSAVMTTGILTLIPIQTFADEPVKGETDDHFTYEITGERTAITGYTGDRETVTSLHIPEKLEGNAVTAIGREAFKDCIALQTLDIPETVMVLDDLAFANTALTEIDLPAQVKTLGGSILKDTPNVKEITFPAGLESVSSGVLAGSSVETVTLEDGMTKAPDYLCSYAEHLKTINIPDSVTSLGYGFLSDSKGFTEFILPVQITEATNAFHSSDLETIRFEDGCTAIPNNLCNNAKQLKNIEWIPSITRIGSGAFSGTAIETADIPNTVKSIGRDAFYWCENLKSIHLPENGCEIENVLFANCTALTEAYIPTGLTGDGSLSIFDQSGLKTITFAPGTTEILNSFCYRCPLETVNLPDGLQTIHAGAFSECASLRKIVIPDSVTVIEDSAFRSCLSLSEVHLPQSLETLGEFAFNRCVSLQNITIPKSLVHGGGNTSAGFRGGFNNCGLREATLEDGAETVVSALFAGCELLEVVHLPASVRHLDNGAFAGCKSLHTLDMPQKAGDIMPGAGGFHATTFDDCDSLYDERFSLYQPAETYVNRVVAVPGADGLINYTVCYSINPLFYDAITTRKEGGYLHITTSYDNQIIAESLPVGVRPEEINDNNRYSTSQDFKINNTETSGVIRFSTRPKGTENLDVKVQLCLWMPDDYQFNYPYKQTIAVNNSASDTETLSMETADFAAWKDGNASMDISGYAPPGSEVNIYVNGETSGRVTANKYTGKYFTHLQIPSANGEMLSVYAQSGEIKSAVKTVRADGNRIDVEKLVFLQDNGHAGVKLDITDAFKKGTTPYIAYNPSRSIGFEATLSDNDCAAVFVISTVNEETSYIELDYDDASGTWKGEGHFKTAVPGTLNVVVYRNTYEATVTIDTGSTGNRPSAKIGSLDVMTAAPKEETDVVRDFIEKEKTELVAADENGYVCHADYAVDGEQGAATFYTGKSDSVFIDGKDVSKEEILKNPAAYGFVETSGNAVDESGAVHAYYIRFVTNNDAAAALADHLYIKEQTAQREPLPGASVQSVSDTVNGAVRSLTEVVNQHQDTAASVVSGSIVVDKIQSAIVGEENKSDIVTTVVTETAKLTISDWLKAAGKGALDTTISTTMTVGEIGFRTVGYAGELSQIYHSDKYGLDNKIAFTVCSTGIFAARLGSIVAGGAVTSATIGAVAVGTLTGGTAILAAGVIVGAVVGINKLIDIVHNWFRPQFSGQAVMTKGFELKYLIDPSGIAYEWVPSNPVKGVKAEIYYKDEKGNAVLWNAEDFDQINPQITDSAGWFAWDVPEGLWQVRLTADGYESIQSEWLPVLPVQTDVNLKMTSTLPSRIAKAVTDGKTVEVQFTKHMLDESITADSLYLTDAAEERIPCTVTAVKETDNDTAATMYFTLTPESAADLNGTALHLTADAKSYAGTPSEAESVTISGRPIRGDVNADGKISIADAVFLARFIAEDTALPSGIQQNITENGIADINGDRETDAFDITAILRVIAGVAA